MKKLTVARGANFDAGQRQQGQGKIAYTGGVKGGTQAHLQAQSEAAKTRAARALPQIDASKRQDVRSPHHPPAPTSLLFVYSFLLLMLVLEKATGGGCEGQGF